MLSLLRITWVRFGFAAALGIVFGILGFQFRWFESLDLKVYDVGLSVRPALESDPDVVIVALDKYSRQNALPPPEFPISAHINEHAKVVEHLSEAGARVIAIDILFDQLDPGLDVSRFVASLEKADKVCLAAAIETITLGMRETGSAIVEERLVIPTPLIPASHYCIGLVNMPVDADLAVRRSSYGRLFQNEWVPSMPAALATAFGKEIQVPRLNSPFFIDYRAARSGFPTIPYIDILNTEGWQEQVYDRIALIGATENSLSDIYELPIRGLPATERGSKLPGVVILAYATETLLQNRTVARLPGLDGLALGIVLVLLTSLTALRRRLVLNAALVIALIVGILICGMLLTAFRLTILPSGLLLSVTIITAVAGLFVNYLHTKLISQLQERELEEISTDLRKAAEIQQRLQPESMPTFEGVDIAGFQTPCKEIGGDYYDVIVLRDKRVGLLIADVCGKGISAAMLMSNLQSNVRQLAPGITSPRELIARLNTVASKVFSEGRFVTLLYGILDISNRRFSYCSGGHMPPLLCRADGDLIQLERGGIPIGPFPDFDWEEHEVGLHSGDLLFMYTDGLSEATMLKTEEMFGEERIRDYLKANYRKAPDQLNHDIVRVAQTFSRSEHLDDDITLLTLRIL